MPAVSTQTAAVNWTEVSKTNPCPICEKPDWCFMADNNDAVICRRVDPISIPPDWKHIKDAKDGYPIYARNNSDLSYGLPKPYRQSQPKPKPKPAPLPKEIQLAKLPESRQLLTPTKGTRNIKDVGLCNTRSIQYPYPDGCFVERVDITKPDGERLSKACYPNHTQEDGTIAKGKGKSDWRPYRIDEIESLNLDGEFVMFGEGEKATEASRYLYLAAITLQGSQWRDNDIQAACYQLKKAGVGGIVYIPDLDAEGVKKAGKVAQAAAAAKFPLIFLDLSLIANADEIGKVKGYDLADYLQSNMKELSLEEIRAQLELTLELSLEDGGGGDDYYNPDSDGGDDGNWYDPDLIENHTFEANCRETLFAENWVVITGVFYRYNAPAGYWEAIEDASVEKLIAAKAERAYKLKNTKAGAIPDFCFYTKNKVKSALEICRADLTVTAPPYNQHLIPFLNGTVDLRTGELQPHNPKNYLTWGISAEYTANAALPPVFEQFIDSSFGLELLPLLRAVISMIVDPTAPYGYFAHFIGDSGSGKGTMLRFLSSLFSENGAIALSAFADINTDEGRHQRLTGKRFCYLPDVGGYQQGLRAAYELIDNGSMGGRPLFKDAYNKRWDVRFAVASVDHLQIENAGDGWERRCIPIPTKKPKTKPDPNLREKLAECRADVISWALAMPKDERNNTIVNARELFPQIRRVKQDAEVYGDSVKSFVDACLAPSLIQPETPIKNAELHTLYREYCRATGYSAMAFNKFVSHLKGVIGENHYRDRTFKKIDGKTVATPSQWENLALAAPGLFIIENPEGNPIEHELGAMRHLNPRYTCITSKLSEGGLQAFEEWESVGDRVACLGEMSQISHVEEWESVGDRVAKCLGEMSRIDHIDQWREIYSRYGENVTQFCWSQMPPEVQNPVLETEAQEQQQQPTQDLEKTEAVETQAHQKPQENQEKQAETQQAQESQESSENEEWQQRWEALEPGWHCFYDESDCYNLAPIEAIVEQGLTARLIENPSIEGELRLEKAFTFDSKKNGYTLRLIFDRKPINDLSAIAIFKAE